MKNILAIDFGVKTIGLALLIHGTSFASSYGTLQNNNDIFLSIKKIIDDENISLIVIGYPMTINGYVSERHSLIKEFVIHLTKVITINCVFEDESYSTIASYDTQKRFNLKNKQIKKHKDAVSAQLILERYLLKVKN